MDDSAEKWTEKLEGVGYYHTLDEALVGCAERQVRVMPWEGSPEALAPLTQALDTLRAEIRTVLSGFKAPRADVQDNQGNELAISEREAA